MTKNGKIQSKATREFLILVSLLIRSLHRTDRAASCHRSRTPSSIGLLVFPVSDQVNDAYRKLDEADLPYPQSMIPEIRDEYAIPMLDLTDPVYRKGDTKLFGDCLHLNGKGNDIVADEIQKRLLAQGL